MSSKNSSTGFILEVTRPAKRGFVAGLVFSPKGPDGRIAAERKVRRDIGRNKALDLAAKLLAASGTPAELVQQVESLKRPEDEQPEDGEPIMADATPEEVQAVERLIDRWSRAVDQALKQGAISNSTASTYRQHPENFLAWVKGEFQPGASGRRRQARADSEAGVDIGE
jgi:hypothetical protein